MRMAFWQRLAILAALMGTGSLSTPAIAAQFEQQEIDSSRFIVLAAPGGELGYKLLILEQIKDNRPCWSETGNSPSQVDPLLLNFDFTGICNRIVDSNGFSVRTAGQDQGLQYSLRVLPTENDLLLVAASNTQRNTYAVIGRTYGMPNGFSRIILEPGWRLTRRSFGGRPLGHVYLTYDQPIETVLSNAPLNSSRPRQPNPILETPAPTNTPGESVIPVPSLPPAPSLNSPPPRPLPSPLPPIPSSPSQSDPATTTVNPPPPPSLAEATPPPSRIGGTASPIGSSPAPAVANPAAPPPAPTTNSTTSSTNSATNSATNSTTNSATTSATNSTTNSATGSRSSSTQSTRSSTSTQRFPTTSNAGGAVVLPSRLRRDAASTQSSQASSSIAQANPDANPEANSGSREVENATAVPQTETYQVVVVADSAETQDRVRSVAPNAFLTSINGQVVMQVGIFRNRSEADRLQQRLSMEGLPTAVIPVR